MKRSGRRLAVATTVAAMALALAACGGGSSGASSDGTVTIHVEAWKGGGAEPANVAEINKAFEKANRQDLADKEKAEVVVLQAYLPARLSADEVAAEVKAIVAEVGAKGPGDMGKVMGAAKARLAGKADMGQVSAAVKAALAG